MSKLVSGTQVLQERGRNWRVEERPIGIRIVESAKHCAKHVDKLAKYVRMGDDQRAKIERDLLSKAEGIHSSLVRRWNAGER